MLDLILRGGLVHPDVNVPYYVEGRRTVPDFRWPEQRLVVEADSTTWHDNQLAREDDAERQALLEAHGERVLRVTWAQAIARPGPTLARLRAAGAPYTDRPMISTNQLKNGNHIEVDGTVFKVLEFQHVKPGKGGAFVRTKLRRASDGNVIDKTFRAGEKFRAVRTEARKMTFLYTDGTDAHFMDAESYEQMAVPEGGVAEALRWTKPNDSVDVLFIDGQPSDLQLPASVVLEVSQTDPGLRGDTASGGGTKPATLETGRDDQRPALRRHRRQRQGRHALGRVHVARLAERVTVGLHLSSTTCNLTVTRSTTTGRCRHMVPEQIERETVIAAPVERVWALLTEAEHLGRWFGDSGAEIDLRPGGVLQPHLGASTAPSAAASSTSSPTSASPIAGR